MNLKDDGGEVISKKILDWITGIITLAAALSTIIGVFFSGDDKKIQQFAYIAALFLIIISGVIFFYQRRRAARLKITESQEPLSATAALRGLLPFEEGDLLPGRARDVQELYTLVSSSAFRFGVLWGESGCGKTSLLRAGLVPILRNEKFLPLYINKPTNNPQEAIRSALLREIQSLEKQTTKGLKQLIESATPKGKKIIILFDQFEEFFLTNRTPKSRAGFIKWLGEAVDADDLPIAFLIGIRADFFAQLQSFAPQIPEPTSTRSTYQLQNFDIEQAKQIFSAAAKADAIPFEPELIQAVIRELETEDLIRPAELQVVGTRLKRKNIFTLNRYESLGGARRILSSYISDEIKQSPNEQAARLVLRLMCADAFETKSPTDFGIEDIIQGLSGSREISQMQSGVKRDEIQKILYQFVTARVLIRTEDDKYNLAHDYLAPYVRTATDGTETNTERANRLLKRYVAEYREDPKVRIPFARLREIQKHASPEIKSQIMARQLIKKSIPDFYVMLVFSYLVRILRVVSLAVLIFFLLLYPFLWTSYYFSVDESFIVIRAGHPQLIFFPGFDEVKIQTGFQESDLDPNFRDEIIRGEVTGFWFNRTEDGYQVWGEQLVQRLEPSSKASALLWLGHFDRATKILSEIILDPQVDANVRIRAIYALGSLAQTRSDAITSDMLGSLSEIVLDPRADPNVRIQAAYALGSVAQTRPDAITSDMLISWRDTVLDPQADPDMRLQAAYALGLLAQAKPDAITSDILVSLSETVLDPQAASNLRSQAGHSLGLLAQARPDAATHEMIASLSEIVLDLQVDSNVRNQAAYALGLLALAKPDAITSDMLGSLIQIILDPQADPNVRIQAIYALGSLAPAKPDAITSDMLVALRKTVLDPQVDFNLRSQAVYALGLLAPAKPDTITSDVLASLSETVLDPQADFNLRSQVAYTMGLLAQARPDAATHEMIASLSEIVLNDQANSYIRFQAAYTLGALAKAKPDAITSDMLASLSAIAQDSQEDSNVRSQAGYILRSLAQTKPDAITSDMLVALRKTVLDPQVDSNVRNQAAYTLGSLAQTRPDAITSDMLASLSETILNPQADSNVRSQAAYTLGSLAQARPDAVSSHIIQSLTNLLKSEIDSHGRKVATYALFGIGFGDANQKIRILKELEKMQASNQPYLRMAAYRLSEMITIGNMAEEARSHPEHIKRLKSSLHYLINLDKSLNSLDQEHISLAASITLDEIDKIEEENK